MRHFSLRSPISLHTITALVFLLTLFRISPTRGASVGTGNQYAHAEVDEGTGRITVYRGFEQSPNAQLTYLNMSYVSVMIGSTVYTNNFQAPLPQPRLLTDGILQHVGDTITLTWSTEQNVDIVQRVYPMSYPLSGVIVVDIQCVNHSSIPLPVRAQVLWDLQYGSIDEPRILADSTLSANWRIFHDGGMPVPRQLFELEATPVLHSFQLKTPGQILLSDPHAGLIPPDTVLYGSWMIMTQLAFGAPPYQNTGVGDAALLEIWKSRTLSAGAKLSVARTAFGAKDLAMCTGSLISLTDYEPQFTTANGLYVDSVTTVHTYLFSPQGTPRTTYGTTTLAVSPELRIVAPTPTLAGGTAQTQGSASESIEPLAVKSYEWSVSPASFITDPDPRTATMQVSLAAPYALDTCDMPVVLEGDQPFDAYRPVMMSDTRTGLTGPLACNARCHMVTVADTGTVVSGLLSIATVENTNMDLNVQPFSNGAASASYTLCVRDSMQDGSATVEHIDRRGNSQDLSYTYCTIADTIRPRVIVAKQAVHGEVAVELRDDKPWDRGIDTFYITNARNVSLNNGPHAAAHGLSVYDFSATIVNESSAAGFCVEVVDRAGLRSERECFSAEPAGVMQEDSLSDGISITGSTGESGFTIGSASATPITAVLFDALGRAVVHVPSFVGSTFLNTRSLPSGTYFLRFTATDHVFTRAVIITH